MPPSTFAPNGQQLLYQKRGYIVKGFSQKNSCIPLQKVVCCIPAERPWIQGARPAACKGRAGCASRMDVAIFFIYLLIIYPACPQGQKTAAQPARAAVFVVYACQTVAPAPAFCYNGIIKRQEVLHREADFHRAFPEKRTRLFCNGGFSRRRRRHAGLPASASRGNRHQCADRTDQDAESELCRNAGYELDFFSIDTDLLMIATIQAANGVDSLLYQLLHEAVK